MKAQLRSQVPRPKRPPRARLPGSIFAPTAVDAKIALGPMLPDLLAGVRSVVELDDPLQVELYGAQLRSALCDSWRRSMNDPESLMARTLVKLTERRLRPDTVALLSAIAAVWPEPAAADAREGLLRLAQQGVSGAVSLSLMSGVRFVGAKFGDGDKGAVHVLLTQFDYPGQRAHCFCVVLDARPTNSIKDAFVTRDVDQIYPVGASLQRFPGLTFRPFDAAAAASIIESGLKAGPEPAHCRVVTDLLRARLRVLATGSDQRNSD